MKTVILGGGGQLAFDLAREMGSGVHSLSHQDLDLCDYDAVWERLEDLKPERVINTAAVTDVDRCEREVEKAFQVHAAGVLNLARVCRDLDCTLVQISTDYVFGGGQDRPYREEDPPDPLNVYGASKLAGEYFARHYAEQSFVVRTAGLFGIGGAEGEGGNFVEAVLRSAKGGKPLRVVEDQITSPTYTRHLAAALRRLLSSGRCGVYHLTNQGQCSWYQFAEEILQREQLTADLQPISSSNLSRAASRPGYSVLDSGKAARVLGGELPAWQDGLADYLDERNTL
mgnify:CR=1 FL=1